MADFENELFDDVGLEPDVAELPVEQPEEQQAEPEANPAPEAAPESTPEPEAPKDEQHVPLGKFLDQRDELREYKRRVAEFEAHQQQTAQTIPDVFDDPQAFAAHQQGLVQKAIMEDRFARSNEDAIEKFGEDKVREAVEWAATRAQANPGFAAEYMGKTRPIQWIVQQHQRDALLSDIGDPSKLDDWFAREAAKRGYVTPNATPAAAIPVATPQQAAPPVKVPRSLATQGSGPSDIRDVATGALAAVDAAFPQ